jgi:HEAT repeat protein
MEDEKACLLMAQFISDPDQANRIFVIKSMARKGGKDSLVPLKEVIFSKTFDAKDFYEKKEYFNTVAVIGGDEVVPDMQKYLHVGWNLFKNVRKEERGLCAASALKRIGSPLAVEALREGGDSRNKAIREACAKALRTLEANQS